MNEEKGFNKTVINCLPCIFTVRQGNLYKMGLFCE